MTSRLDSRQSRQRAKLDQLSTATDLRLDSLLNLINDELTMPLRMRANLGSGVDGSPNQNLYVDGVSVQTYDSGAADSGHERNRTILPIGGTIPNYNGGGYVSFTQAAPGGAIVFAGTGLTLTGTYSLTMTANQFVKILVWINANNEFGLEIGTPSSTLVGASIPEFPLDAFALGFLVLTTNSSAVISKVLNENIYQFANNGGAANGSSVSKVINQANTFAVGDVVYLNGTIYQKAQANSSTTSEAIGIVSKASSTKFTLTEIGYVKNLSGLVAGGVYFLSDSVAGGLTINEPVVLGSVSKPMLIADTTTSGYVLNYRGVIVGGTNARTQISLSATTTAQTVYIAPVGLNAGELTGWIYLDATTDLKFYVSAKFVKTGDNSNWNISPTYVGETPPSGFSMTITSGGAIQITMNPLPSGFVSGYINYAVNAPSVGATYPLSIDANTIVGTLPISKGGTGQTTANSALNALLPVQTGYTNKYLKTDGSGTTSWASAAGGSGEINAITNSSGVDGNTIDWVVGTVPTTSHSITVASGSTMPLFPTINTAFAISSSTAVVIGSQTNASGVYDSFTMPPGLRNRKLKVEFYFNTPASTDGTWGIAVYSGSTKVLLTTDTGSPKDTILPANVSGGKFVAYFDTDSSTTYSLNFIQRTRVNPNTLYVTNVIVGPGIQPQGAVVGEWQNFTPATFGATTYSSLTGRYRRVGDSAQIRISATINAASGTYWFDMPSSIGTIDTTKVRNGNYQDQYGVATYYNSPSVNYAGIVQKTNVANRVRIVGPSGGNEWSQATNTPTTPAAGHGMELEFTVPIAEWAGSGTVQLAQNDVEYASNNSGLTTAGGSNTSSFAYGPAGVALGSIASTTAASSTTTMRVRFQTQIQAGDLIVVETDLGQNEWVPAAQRFPWIPQNLSFYGINTIAVSGSTTDVDVLFGNSGASPYGATTYGANGQTWGTFSTWKWRVRKSSAGAAVGFGVADANSAGLVNPYTQGSGVVYAGTYTPTVSGTVNITGSPTVRSHNYIRLGSIVYVTGSLTATITTTNTDTSFNLSLPVATANFASAYDGHGTMVITNSANNAKDAGVIFMNSSAQTASFSVENVTVGTGVSGTINYSFSYKIN